MKSIKEKYVEVCQKIGAMKVAPTSKTANTAMFLFGITVFTVGLARVAHANELASEAPGVYDDTRMGEAVALMFRYMEGTFGALIMTAAGFGAILSSAFGQYKAALGLLIIAVGTFILRSFITTFFNVEDIDGFSPGN